MPGALEGIRVVDFGQYIAGPLAAVMLGSGTYRCGDGRHQAGNPIRILA